MQKIFISYRRADTADVTGRVCDYLREHFGDEVLFKDVDSIPFGEQFPEAIEEAIAGCEVLIAMIGAQWLSITGRDGKRRLDNPNDFVRREVASAFAQGKTVVPVLVHGAPMPAASQLPGELEALPTTNAAPVRPDPDFASDMARLCRYLEDGAGFFTEAAQRRRYTRARRHELDGDYGAARADYLEYFGFDLPYLDPHLRFCDFLKVQEGRDEAREIYTQATARSGATAPKLAAIGLLPVARRDGAYQAFTAAHPDFAPAWYLWSELYSADRLGERSLDEVRRERELLQRFVELDQAGKFAPHCIDTELVSAWRRDAAERLEATQAKTDLLEMPVSVLWNHANTGWFGSIQLFEPALEVFWRAPGSEEFVATGMTRVRHHATGRPQPNLNITLPSDHPPGEGAIRYTNSDGRVVGPFPVQFDPAASNLSSSKETLRLTRQGWVSLRDYEGRVLLYFSHLLAYRGVLTRIEYGVGREQPDTEFAFAPWDGPGVAPITPETEICIEVPDSTRFVTVRLTYRDGTQSPVMRYTR